MPDEKDVKLVDNIEEALELGKQLRDPNTYKNKAKIFSTLSTILTVILTVLALLFNGDDVDKLKHIQNLPWDQILNVLSIIISFIATLFFKSASIKIERKLQLATNSNAGKERRK